nr:PfkB family carbohydrate kinase [Streptomyces sp. SID5468]
MLAEPGVPLDRAAHFRRSLGGEGAAVAAGLARLGHRTRWIGRVGADPAGDIVLRELRADGVDTGYATRDPHAATAVALREGDPPHRADPPRHHAGSAAARLAPRHIPPDALAGARLLHLSGATAMLSADAADATWRLLTLAHEAGLTVSFDPGARHGPDDAEARTRTVAPLLAEADLVIADAAELALLTGVSADDAADDLLSGRTRAVIVRRPGTSATAVLRSGRLTHPAFPVPAGAGPAFVAGYLSGWLRDVAVDQALAEAAAVSALAARTAGETDGLPTAAGRDRALDALRRGEDPAHR